MPGFASLLLPLVLSQPAAPPEDPATQPTMPAFAAQPPVEATAKRTPLNEAGTLQLVVEDEERSVWLRSRVVLRDGLLEMFLCRTKSKEHESILAADVPAAELQAGLLAAGFEAGQPVRFEPEYQPPTGERLAIDVFWTKGDALQSASSKDWIRHAVNKWHAAPLAKEVAAKLPLDDEEKLRYFEYDADLIYDGRMTDDEFERLQTLSDEPAYRQALRTLKDAGTLRPLTADWVFAGSEWIEFEGTREFAADSGNYVCVANFSDAIIDIDERSTNTNGALLYEPWTERIPPIGTWVWVRVAKVRLLATGAATDEGR